MSEDPKGFDAGDYNLFRYCANDPIDFTDPMGLEINWDGNSPLNNHNMSTADPRWAMAKWADSSNNLQISFGQFTASQGLSMGQSSPAFTTNYPKGDRSTASRAYKMFAVTKRGREKGKWGRIFTLYITSLRTNIEKREEA